MVGNFYGAVQMALGHTGWIEGSVKPTMPGLYMRMYQCHQYWSWWSGSFWGGNVWGSSKMNSPCLDHHIRSAYLFRNHASKQQDLPWRGRALRRNHEFAQTCHDRFVLINKGKYLKDVLTKGPTWTTDFYAAMLLSQAKAKQLARVFKVKRAPIFP